MHRPRPRHQLRPSPGLAVQLRRAPLLINVVPLELHQQVPAVVPRPRAESLVPIFSPLVEGLTNSKCPHHLGRISPPQRRRFAAPSSQHTNRFRQKSVDHRRSDQPREVSCKMGMMRVTAPENKFRWPRLATRLLPQGFQSQGLKMSEMTRNNQDAERTFRT